MGKFIFLVSACFLFSYLSCVQEESIPFKYPKVYTDPVSDITPAGARFNATVDFVKMDEITDFGFIWGQDPNLSSTTFILPTDTLIGNVFYADIRSSLKDKNTYYARCFVKKSGKTIYGNIVSFKSLGSEGPKITGLNPETAGFGDTVRVIGRNFSSNAILKYGSLDISSSILEIKKDRITFIVPEELPISPVEDFVSVSIEGNLTKSPIPLKLDLDRIRPNIISITPSTVKACDTVVIKGKNLILKGKELRVSDNSRNLVVLKATKDSIVCVLKSIPKDEINFTIDNGLLSTSSQGIDLIEIRAEIISVSPLVYSSKEIITIKVKNFPFCDNTVFVSIKDRYITLPIISKSKDHITVQLPEGCLGNFNILVTLPVEYNYSNTQYLETPLLSPVPPEIFSIEPEHGSWGDEIVIKGNMLKGASVNMLDTTSTSNTEIRGKLNEFGMPKENGFVDVEVINCGYATKENGFKYDPIEILDFNPKTITSPSQEMTITGKNFSSYQNTVHIGPYTFLVPSTDHRTITFPLGSLMPDATTSVNGSFSLTIINGQGNQVTSPTPVQINYEASWKRLNDFPFDGIYLGVSFSVDGKGYVGSSGVSNNFWQYDPNTDSWAAKASYPGHPDRYKASTEANNKAYVGLGLDYNSEWWEYDPAIDTWTQKSNYPGRFASGAFAFEVGGKVYAGGGAVPGGGNVEFWEYNPATNLWSRKADIPPFNPNGTVNFGFNGKGYVYARTVSGLHYETAYDPTSNTWTSRQIKLFEKSSNNNYMIFQDCVVIGGESLDYFQQNAFLKIVPGTGNFEKADYAGAFRKGQIGFAIGNYGYWGLGIDVSNYQGSLEIWKFDPSKFR